MEYFVWLKKQVRNFGVARLISPMTQINDLDIETTKVIPKYLQSKVGRQLSAEITFDF